MQLIHHNYHHDKRSNYPDDPNDQPKNHIEYPNNLPNQPGNNSETIHKTGQVADMQDVSESFSDILYVGTVQVLVESLNLLV